MSTIVAAGTQERANHLLMLSSSSSQGSSRRYEINHVLNRRVCAKASRLAAYVTQCCRHGSGSLGYCTSHWRSKVFADGSPARGCSLRTFDFLGPTWIMKVDRAIYLTYLGHMEVVEVLGARCCSCELTHARNWVPNSARFWINADIGFARDPSPWEPVQACGGSLLWTETDS